MLDDCLRRHAVYRTASDDSFLSNGGREAVGAASDRTMPECTNCGSHVTRQYCLVFSTDDRETHGCPNCKNSNEIFNGAAARPASAGN